MQVTPVVVKSIFKCPKYEGQNVESANFVQCQREMNELFYQCQQKQHEEKFQQLDSSVWCSAVFSCKLPDTSLSADWTRIRKLSRCLLMRREKDVASLGSWSVFVRQMKTAASLFHQQRQSLVHLDLNRVEKLVARCLTFFAGVLWKHTCMSSNFADFYAPSTVGGVVGSWLVFLTPDRAVQVWGHAGETVLCSWARHLTFIVPLYTQVCKWVPANCWGNLTNCGEWPVMD